jgi:hypothetical protein
MSALQEIGTVMVDEWKAEAPEEVSAILSAYGK